MLPVLLLLVLTALDLGRVFMGWVVLNNAARVGANYAASHADASFDQASYESLVTDARDDALGTLGDCGPIPDPAYPSGVDLGDYAEVILDCEFRPLTPIIGDVFASGGNAFRVTARSVFPVRVGLLAAAEPPPPTVTCESRYTWEPTNPIAGEPVVFTDATPPTASGWTWRFGDGTANANAVSPSHTFATAGTYVVKLDSNSNGIPCTTYERSIQVQEAPPPPNSCTSFTWDPVSPVAGTEVVFTDGTDPVASDWTWTFGSDPQTVSTQNATYTFQPPGTYSVRLVSKSNGADCEPYTAQIVVTPPVELLCKVPSFANTWYRSTNDPAQALWQSAGFTTKVGLAPGNNKNKDWLIQWQSLVGGQDTACNSLIDISATEPKKP